MALRYSAGVTQHGPDSRRQDRDTGSDSRRVFTRSARRCDGQRDAKHTDQPLREHTANRLVDAHALKLDHLDETTGDTDGRRERRHLHLSGVGAETGDRSQADLSGGPAWPYSPFVVGLKPTLARVFQSPRLSYGYG
jgi:hypothetical protein